MHPIITAVRHTLIRGLLTVSAAVNRLTRGRLPHFMFADERDLTDIKSTVRVTGKTDTGVTLTKFKSDGTIDNGDFKILSATDLHLGPDDRKKKVFVKGYKLTRKTVKNFIRTVKEERPDLVILTGDVILSDCQQTDAVQFSRMMEKLGVYWCYVFGNHEAREEKEYFKYLYRNELIERNPAEWLEAPAVKNREKAALEASDVRAMVNAATNIRNKAIIMMLAQTGLRIHELSNITLEQYESRVNNMLVICGKGDKDRLVGLSDETCELIDEYVATSRKNGCEYLFVGNQGNKLDGKNTSAMLKVTAKKAGIANWEDLHISNHTMRRTFATMMSEADVPIEVISKAMGHSGIQVTSRYVKRTEQRAVNAMSVVNF